MIALCFFCSGDNGVIAITIVVKVDPPMIAVVQVFKMKYNAKRTRFNAGRISLIQLSLVAVWLSFYNKSKKT